MFGNNIPQVQNDPGVIIGPIARLFGYIIDFMFNIVSGFTEAHTLGLAIILMTLVVRALMLPLAVKSQKSMMAMQKLNPEVEKIRAKYSSSNDPEIKQKMNVEIQSLYAKNKVNPLGGCLPLLIQMPFFFGLMYIMNQSYLYVKKLQDVYHLLSARVYEALAAQSVQEMARLVEGSDDYKFWFGLGQFRDIANQYIPQKMREAGAANPLDIAKVEDMSKILNRFSAESWEQLFATVPPEHLGGIMEVFAQKQSIELFMGLNLIEQAGWAWPGILIPILAGGATFLTSWLSQQMSATSDPKMKTQQTMMMVIMPFFMAFITVGMPAGVGVYWITSSVFQVAQQVVMNKRAGLPLFKKKQTQTVSPVVSKSKKKS
jgi:YidC/Oxa1 family membrane protein insertase